MSDIVLTRLNQDAMEFYCNCNESDDYNTFKYIIDNDIDRVTSIDLELKPDIYLDMMKTGRYIFWCENEEGNKSEQFHLNFKGQSKREYFDEIYPDRTGEENYIINSIDSRNYMEELFGKFLEAENDIEKKNIANILEKVVSATNKNIRKINWKNNFTDLKADTSYTFYIDFTRTHDMFRYGTEINIEAIEIEKGENDKFQWNWKHIGHKRVDEIIDIKNIYINPGLYRVKLYSYGETVCYFYGFYSGLKPRHDYFVEDQKMLRKTQEDKINKFDFVLDIDVENKDELMETIAVLDVFNSPRIQMFQNLFVYKDEDDIVAELSDIYNFSKETEIDLFLKCYSEEDYLNPEYNPISIKIDAPELRINQEKIDEMDIVFYLEKYYFRIEDASRNIVSNTCVVDINSSKDSIDYNSIYNSLFVDTEATRLFNIAESNGYKNDEAYSIKNILNRYKSIENFYAYDMTQYLIENLLESEENVGGVLPSILDYDFIYRREKDRSFFNKRISKRAYWTHVIPKGDYIVKITEVDKKKLNVKYIYEPGKSQEIYYKNCDFMIIEVIDPKTYKRSGWMLYDNMTNPNITLERHENSLEVETINGL